MPEWIDGALAILKDYWPFVTQVLCIWYLGQVFKKRVWTKKRASTNKYVKFMRDTLPFHPLIAGIVWGAFYPLLPAASFVVTRSGAINEGLLAGLISIVGHTGLEHYAAANNIKWLLATLRDTVSMSES